MLTTLFYYNHYKPYIVSNADPRSADFPRKSKITEKNAPEKLKSQIFFLNKSLKNEIVSFAKHISSSVSGVKESARQLVSDMERFNRNVEEEGIENAKKWIAEDLQSFSEAYEQADQFMETQSQSRGLKDFIEELRYSLFVNKEEIASLGMKMADEKISFSPDAISEMDSSEMNVAIGRSIRVFDDIYKYSTELLTSPMVEHMNFKEFQYHYNYKMGSVVTDSFNMIEAGMVVDMLI